MPKKAILFSGAIFHCDGTDFQGWFHSKPMVNVTYSDILELIDEIAALHEIEHYFLEGINEIEPGHFELELGT